MLKLLVITGLVAGALAAPTGRKLLEARNDVRLLLLPCTICSGQAPTTYHKFDTQVLVCARSYVASVKQGVATQLANVADLAWPAAAPPCPVPVHVEQGPAFHRGRKLLEARNDGLAFHRVQPEEEQK